MAEVGIQRFAASDAEEDSAEGDEADLAMREHERNRVIGIDRREHCQVVDDMVRAERSQREKPHHHHRPEGCGDPVRTAALHGEQDHEDQHRQRHDVMFELGRGELQTFDGRQNRNRRRDHGIAEEHRCPHDAEREQHPGLTAERALAKRHQGQGAPFAVVVGAQKQQHVFRRHHDEQRPQHQRQHAQHDRTGDDPCSGRIMSRLAESVERRGADVAKHHADGAQSQAPGAVSGSGLAREVGGRFDSSHEVRKTP